MDDITDVVLTDLEKSPYIKTLQIHYTQNGLKKKWDSLTVHDSVCVVIFNTSRNVFIFVKQFRPAVYICAAEREVRADGKEGIDTTKYPGSLGVTYELCAGIVDKDTSLAVIAQEEILEECGYKVPEDHIVRVCSYRSGVGTSGAEQTLFYAEVTDEMKVGAGGGIHEEGEMIDVVEIPVSEGKQFIMDETKRKPVGMMFALMWFYENKWKQTDSV